MGDRPENVLIDGRQSQNKSLKCYATEKTLGNRESLCTFKFGNHRIRVGLTVM